MSHSFFHILRWGLNNDLHLLVETASGITGMIAAGCTVLIVWPMFIGELKSLPYELRKCLHYLSWLWVSYMNWIIVLL